MAAKNRHLPVKMNFNFSDDSSDDNDSSFISKPQIKNILQELKLGFNNERENDNKRMHNNVESDKSIVASSHQRRKSELPSLCNDFEPPVSESTRLSSIDADLPSHFEEKLETDDRGIFTTDKANKNGNDDSKFQQKKAQREEKENIPDITELKYFYNESTVLLHTPQKIIRHQSSPNKSATYNMQQIDWEDLLETPLRESKSARKLKLYKGDVNLSPVHRECEKRLKKINPVMHGKLSFLKAATECSVDDSLSISREAVHDSFQNFAKSDSDCSIEVEDVSIQTSFILDNGGKINEENYHKNVLSSNGDSMHANSSTSDWEHSASFVEVQDISVQADMDKEEECEDERNTCTYTSLDHVEQSSTMLSNTNIKHAVDNAHQIGYSPDSLTDSGTDSWQSLSNKSDSSCLEQRFTDGNTTSHSIAYNKTSTQFSSHYSHSSPGSLQPHEADGGFQSQLSTYEVNDVSLQVNLHSSLSSHAGSSEAMAPTSAIKYYSEEARDSKRNFHTDHFQNPDMILPKTEIACGILDVTSTATKDFQVTDDESSFFTTAHENFHTDINSSTLSLCSERSFASHSSSGTQQVRVSTILYESAVENVTIHNKSSGIDLNCLDHSPVEASVSYINPDLDQFAGVKHGLDKAGKKCPAIDDRSPLKNVLVPQTDSEEEASDDGQDKSDPFNEHEIGESDVDDNENKGNLKNDHMEIGKETEAIKFTPDEFSTKNDMKNSLSELKNRGHLDGKERLIKNQNEWEQIPNIDDIDEGSSAHNFETKDEREQINDTQHADEEGHRHRAASKDVEMDHTDDDDEKHIEETQIVVATYREFARVKDKMAMKKDTISSLTNELGSVSLAGAGKQDSESSEDDCNFDNFLSKIKDSVKLTVTSEKDRVPMSEFIVNDDEDESSSERDDDEDDDIFCLKMNNVLESCRRRPMREKQIMYTHPQSDHSTSGSDSGSDSDLDDFIVDKPAKKCLKKTKALVPVFDLSSGDDSLLREEPDRGKNKQDSDHHKKSNNNPKSDFHDDIRPAKNQIPLTQTPGEEMSNKSKSWIATSGKNDQVAWEPPNETPFKTPLKLPNPVRQWDRPFETPTSRRTERDFKTPNKGTGVKSHPSTAPRPSRPSSIGLDDNAYFLKSLMTDYADCNRHPDAARFVKRFKDTKAELAQRLFKIFNHAVFEDKLPKDFEIEWSPRYTKTAGTFYYKGTITNFRTKVTLSVKICDNAERVRDTLAHELCHAAVKLINGVNESHGKFWKSWARRTNRMFPFMPLIARCHDYVINTKYTYQCVNCKYRIGRHSKSLDTNTKVCGHCLGKFEVYLTSELNSSTESSRTPATPRTPRTPNKFALFVKECYSDVKKRDGRLKHGDVMKILSKQFAEKNKISD